MVDAVGARLVDTTGATRASWSVGGCAEAPAVLATPGAGQVLLECGGGLGEPSTAYALAAPSGSAPKVLWKDQSEDLLCADRAAQRVLRGTPDTSGFGGGEQFAWLDPATGKETDLPEVASASPATAVCGAGVAATTARANGGGIRVVLLGASADPKEALPQALPTTLIPVLQNFDAQAARLLFGVYDEQQQTYGIARLDLQSGDLEGLVQFPDTLGAAVFTPGGRIVVWSRPAEGTSVLQLGAIDPGATKLAKMGTTLPSDARDMMPSDDGAAGLVVAGGGNDPVRYFLIDLASDKTWPLPLGAGQPRVLIKAPAAAPSL
jgi:hypothetical protein